MRLTDSISRSVTVLEQVWGVDERRVGQRCDHGDGDGFLLDGLGANGSSPSEDDRVDTVRSDREDA